MKITAKQFALSLYESIEGKSAAEVKVVIKKFVEVLAGKNRIAKAEKIIAEFVKIWHTKHGIVEALATSANGLNKADVKLLKNYIADLSGAKEVILAEKIDKSILGGVIIKYGDKILDGSLKTQLADLKNRMMR